MEQLGAVSQRGQVSARCPPSSPSGDKIPGNESARAGNADVGKGVMGLAGLNPECTSLPRPQCAVCTQVWCGAACLVKHVRSENSKLTHRVFTRSWTPQKEETTHVSAYFYKRNGMNQPETHEIITYRGELK